MYHDLVKKFNAIDTSRLIKKTDYDAKIDEMKGEIPSIAGLAITSALNAVDNKIPDVSNLVKNTDYDVKISDIESKYLPHLIIIILHIIYLIQTQKKQSWLMSLVFLDL